MNRRQFDYLQDMGITVWVKQSQAEGQDRPQDRLTGTTGSKIPDQTARPDWKLSRLVELGDQVAGCVACPLHKTRTQTVFGVGNPDADWLVVGEAPGAEEDRQGKPFVGRAGKLLDAMLSAIGMAREQVYIANILKCRPPSNRDPNADEIQACAAYLRQQIEWIRPKLILAVGRVAAQNLLAVATPIGKMRGQPYYYSDMKIPVVVTYHPAYLLRAPREKSKVWDDLRRAMNLYRQQ